MRLFNIDKIKCYDFDKFEFKTYFDFKDNGTVINMDIYNELLPFLKNVYSQDFPLFFHCMSLFNTIGKYKKYKCLKLRIKNDYILILYTYIKIFKTSQIRIFNLPISLNKDIDNVELVMKYLNKLDFVKFAVSDKTKLDLFENKKPIHIYRDYYYNRMDYIFTKRRKNKHCIDSAFNNEDIEFRFYFGNNCSVINYQDVFDLYDIWAAWSGYYITKERQRVLLSIITSDNENVYKSAIYYRGYPICFDVGIIDFELKICQSLGIIHLGRMSKQQKDLGNVEFSKILNNLMYIEKYILFNALSKFGINKIYIAGADKNTTLDLHKQKTTEGYIEYYLCTGYNK